jgi:1-acyl-sn-glycerol-3-phosphate acyltransferase
MIYKFIMKILGWKIDYNLPEEFNRCVLIAAPHTSNWDFLYCVLTFRVLKIPYKFTIKKEWFRFPFNLIIKPLGGLAVDTENKNNTVDIMTKFFEKNKHFTMAVTPEGSRSKIEEWKSGFYRLAKQAKVPICLGYLDYKTKTAGVGAVVYPSEDMKNDLKKVMHFYETKQPKYPKKFSTDIRYN